MVTRSPLTTTAGVRLWAACGMSFTLHNQCLVVFSLEFSSTLRRAQNCSTWNHLIRPTGLGRTCHICLLCRIINRQECIPVGCVPPTSVAISGCVWCTPSCPHTSHPHTPPLSAHTHIHKLLPCPQTPPLSTHPCSRPLCPSACWDTYPSPYPKCMLVYTTLPKCMLGFTHHPAQVHAGIHPPPPMNSMTDTCENMTLPQTSFADGKNLHFLFKQCQ